MVKMVDKDGKMETDRMSIANIFADFYEQLYALRHESHENTHQDDESETIAPFTRDERLKTIKSLNFLVCHMYFYCSTCRCHELVELGQVRGLASLPGLY